MTTPDQGSGTRPRVSDAEVARYADVNNITGLLVKTLAMDLRDARATAARYEAALADLVAEAEKVIRDHDKWHCDSGTGDLPAVVARARALSSGGSGEAKGREA